MITYKENTTLVGVSELRKGIDKILEKAGKGLVIIEKRHKPAAVLISNEEYEKMQNTIETVEEIVLGLMARQRFMDSKEEDYIDIEKLMKKLNR